MKPWLAALVTIPAAVYAQAPTGATYWSSTGRFVGSAACASCHGKQAEQYRANSMSRALETVDKCSILQGNIRYAFKDGGYAWSITREKGKVIYKVTNGVDTFSTPIEFAFGQGKAGQTYVFSTGGHYYETRVSYYAQLGNLDLTVGAGNSKPTDLMTAAGRIMEGNEPRNCFGCHTTGARIAGTLQLDHYEPGVQCESCHGAGGDHIDAVRAGRTAAGTIRGLANMDPQESNEFCGTCHRTWQTVMAMGIKGINTARFPAYRLTGSPCFSMDDHRIACTSCHEPHSALVEDDKYYDSKCVACHTAGKKTCPVAKQSCTSCHMQRVSPPEAHHAFPDHWFRIVRSKNDYPE